MTDLNQVAEKFQEDAEFFTGMSNTALTSVPHPLTCNMTGEQLHQWAQANGGDLPMDATREDYQRVVDYCKAQVRYHGAVAVAAAQELKDSAGELRRIGTVKVESGCIQISDASSAVKVSTLSNGDHEVFIQYDEEFGIPIGIYIDLTAGERIA